MRFNTAEALAEVIDEKRFHTDPSYHHYVRVARDLFEVMEDEMVKAGVPEKVRTAVLRGASGEIVRREKSAAAFMRLFNVLTRGRG